MINLDTVLKSRDITLLTKVHIFKAVVFPIVKYGCESWTIKKAASGWVLVAQFCPTLCNSMDCSCQAPLFMEFSRQEYWSRQPFSSAGDLPDSDLDRTQVSYLASRFFTLWATREASQQGSQRRLSTKELMLSNCGVGEDSWESLGLQGDHTSQS